MPRPVKATPMKKTEPLPPQQLQTPAKTSSIPASAAKVGSAFRGNPKLRLSVVPTPTNYMKAVHKSEASTSPDVPRIMKPKKLLTACSVDSIPDHLAAPPAGLLTPSAVASKLRRPSALPTPVNRRVSGIPALTPKSVSHLSKPVQITQRSSTADEVPTCLSPENMKESEKAEYKQPSVSIEEICPPADLQPCSLLFNMEDESEGSPACEPADMEPPPEPPSHQPEPSSCDPEPPSPVDIKSPAPPTTADMLKQHPQKNMEKKRGFAGGCACTNTSAVRKAAH